MVYFSSHFLLTLAPCGFGHCCVFVEVLTRVYPTLLEQSRTHRLKLATERKVYRNVDVFVGLKLIKEGSGEFMGASSGGPHDVILTTKQPE